MLWTAEEVVVVSLVSEMRVHCNVGL